MVSLGTEGEDVLIWRASAVLASYVIILVTVTRMLARFLSRFVVISSRCCMELQLCPKIMQQL